MNKVIRNITLVLIGKLLLNRPGDTNLTKVVIHFESLQAEYEQPPSPESGPGPSEPKPA